MSLMVGDKLAVPRRYALYALGRRSGRSVDRKKLRRRHRSPESEELRFDLSRQYLGKEGGHRIPDLPLHFTAGSRDHYVIGKRLQSTDLSHAQTPVLPMKRPYGGSWLRLDGP